MTLPSDDEREAWTEELRPVWLKATDLASRKRPSYTVTHMLNTLMMSEAVAPQGLVEDFFAYVASTCLETTCSSSEETSLSQKWVA